MEDIVIIRTMCYYVKADWRGAITCPSSLAVRMPPCHGGGRRFKSDLGRHFENNCLGSSVGRAED
ncbi:MAG: hypothetical protein H6Q68_2227 [Firmicutes bacterium]|nr:hypothetical protein [Bacillota bacterium]